MSKLDDLHNKLLASSTATTRKPARKKPELWSSHKPWAPITQFPKFGKYIDSDTGASITLPARPVSVLVPGSKGRLLSHVDMDRCCVW